MRPVKRKPTKKKPVKKPVVKKLQPGYFDFGEGPVPAYRHRNPNGETGGWVARTAVVEDSCWVQLNAQVYGNAKVAGRAKILGNSKVFGFACVKDSARVEGNARIFGAAIVCDDAVVDGNILITNRVTDITVGGKFRMHNHTSHKITISRSQDFMVIGPLGSRVSYLTITFKPQVILSTGCFTGTLSEFKKAVLNSYKRTSIGFLRQDYLDVIKLVERISKNRQKKK